MFKERLYKLRFEKRAKEKPNCHKRATAFDMFLEVKTPRSAAQFEGLIVEYVNVHDYCEAHKVEVKGTFRKGTKVVADVLGRKKQIGSDMYTKTTAKKGQADVSATIFGLRYEFEVKFSKSDKQRKEQKEFEDDVKKAGGEYFIVRDLDQFAKIFEEILNSDKVKVMREMQSKMF